MAGTAAGSSSFRGCELTPTHLAPTIIHSYSVIVER
jgi:hypothetical protein